MSVKNYFMIKLHETYMWPSWDSNMRLLHCNQTCHTTTLWSPATWRRKKKQKKKTKKKKTTTQKHKNTCTWNFLFYFIFFFFFGDCRNNSKYSDRRSFANSVDKDQTPQDAASDQDLHRLPYIQQYFRHSNR